MKLILTEQRAQLLRNGSSHDEDHDPVPVLKLFTPAARCTWLVTEMDPENEDILFGLADLGLGYPELGSFSLAEISQPVASPVRTGRALLLTQPQKMPLERDRFWDAKGIPISVFAELARNAGHIIDRPPPKGSHNVDPTHFFERKLH